MFGSEKKSTEKKNVNKNDFLKLVRTLQILKLFNFYIDELK